MKIEICGGLYREICAWPKWNEVYGSGGRAAHVLSKNNDVVLNCFSDKKTIKRFKTAIADPAGIQLRTKPLTRSIEFNYLHSLSEPVVTPPNIKQNNIISIKSSAVLRFGMIEGTAVVDADFCVYDPQSPGAPEAFHSNGSSAKNLAIVANKEEALLLSRASNIDAAAAVLLKSGARTVVVKDGPSGGIVFTKYSKTKIPAYKSEFVWKIGSGDVFAATFFECWALRNIEPIESAQIASRAVSEYTNSMSLPLPSVDDLKLLQKKSARKDPAFRKIYLAGPFFSIHQRWMVNETRHLLMKFGLYVFSPVHDVGFGSPSKIAADDIAGLQQCDAVFAILDGMDPGTLFEIGYARSIGKPVFAICQSEKLADLTMLQGTNCLILDDLATLIYRLRWGG